MEGGHFYCPSVDILSGEWDVSYCYYPSAVILSDAWEVEVIVKALHIASLLEVGVIVTVQALSYNLMYGRLR